MNKLLTGLFYWASGAFTGAALHLFLTEKANTFSVGACVGLAVCSLLIAKGRMDQLTK